jgi:hypothetical protein
VRPSTISSPATAATQKRRLDVCDCGFAEVLVDAVEENIFDRESARRYAALYEVLLSDAVEGVARLAQRKGHAALASRALRADDRLERARAEWEGSFR